MGSTGKFSALNTKIQGMNAKLLKDKDYEKMLSFETEKEIGNYLKNETRYSNVLQSHGIESLRRWELELLLKKESLSEVEKLGNYLGSNYKGFLKMSYLRAEVEDIKLILRAISRKEDLSELPQHFLHNPKYESVNFEALLSKNNLVDLVDVFKGSIFEEAFRSITEEDLKLREFHAEMNLDMIYFKELRKSSEKFSKLDKKILTEILGINIDLINIQWIYRAKKYYNLMNEEIVNYTLLGGKRLSFKKIKEIVYSDDYEKSLAEILSRYGFKIVKREDYYMQVAIFRYLLFQMKDYDKRYPMSIAKLIRYIHEIEYEAVDITSIIEAVRYNSKDIKRLLIKGGEGSWQ